MWLSQKTVMVTLGGGVRTAVEKSLRSAAAKLLLVIHYPTAGFLGKILLLRSSLRPGRPPPRSSWYQHCSFSSGQAPTICWLTGARESPFKDELFPTPSCWPQLACESCDLWLQSRELRLPRNVCQCHQHLPSPWELPAS